MLFLTIGMVLVSSWGHPAATEGARPRDLGGARPQEGPAVRRALPGAPAPPLPHVLARPPTRRGARGPLREVGRVRGGGAPGAAHRRTARRMRGLCGVQGAPRAGPAVHGVEVRAGHAWRGGPAPAELDSDGPALHTTVPSTVRSAMIRYVRGARFGEFRWKVD